MLVYLLQRRKVQRRRPALDTQRLTGSTKKSERGLIQPSVFSQANVLLHSKHRTGLSWSAVSSKHSGDCSLKMQKHKEHFEFQATLCFSSYFDH